MISKKKRPLFTNQGLNINYMNFTVKSKETVEKILKIYGKTFFKTQGTVGSGALKYTGNWNEEKSVFIGGNNSLGSFLVRYENEASVKELDKLREEFFYKSENSTHFANITISSAQANLVINNVTEATSFSSLRTMFEKTVQAQQKSTPKVSIYSDELCIGSKSSSVCVGIVGLPEASVTVENIGVSLKLKDASGIAFYNTLQASIESSVKDMIANVIYGQLSKMTLTDLTEILRRYLANEYNIGKVISSNQVKSRSVSKTGKYTQRVLVGITNKLMDANSEETREILINWLVVLYNQRASIEKHEALFKDICGAVTGTRTVSYVLPTVTALNIRKSSKLTPKSSPVSFDFLNQTNSEIPEPDQNVNPTDVLTAPTEALPTQVPSKRAPRNAQ